MPDTTSSTEKLVLHVGCGTRREGALHPDYLKPEWRELRLDINPDTDPDIVASMTDMSAVDSESADAIWSSHALEHLFSHEVPIALREFHRVLKPGGHVFLRLPNLEEAVLALLRRGPTAPAYTSASGPISALDMIFGLGKAIEAGETAMQHRTGFTKESILQLLQEAGFENANSLNHQSDIWARGEKH